VTNRYEVDFAIETRWWERVAPDRVKCTVCPRGCTMHDGQRGLCFVRGAEGGAVKLYTYGRSSGFCVDPIEKKPLNHFLPGTPVLSFGTAGCNLACKFCQNWDMSKSREMDTLMDRASPVAIAAAAVATGCAQRCLHLQRPGRSSWSTPWTWRTPAASAACARSP
jgi:pyruvate formate lyase activating enzyme